MPAKRNPDHLPKPMAEIKKHLESSSLDITGDSLKNIDPKLRRAGFSCLGTSLAAAFPDQHAQYKKLQYDFDKRKWLAAFIVDPASGCSKVINTTVRKTTETEQETDVWVTESQLAGPMYLNNAAHAAAAIKSMIPRPFKDNKSLQDMGVKQYNWTVFQSTRTKSLEKSATLSTEAELEPEDVGTVKAHIDEWGTTDVQDSDKRSGPQSSRKRKGKAHSAEPDSPPPVDLTPTKKARKDAVEKYDDAMKKTKAFYDKQQKELGLVEVIKQKLSSRGWGEGPITYLSMQTETQQKLSEDLFAKWASFKAKPIGDMVVGEIDIASTAIETHRADVEKSYKEFRTNVLSDFDKFKSK
eukprot:9477099-Pyramimonas_sp.AAC.1